MDHVTPSESVRPPILFLDFVLRHCRPSILTVILPSMSPLTASQPATYDMHISNLRRLIPRVGATSTAVLHDMSLTSRRLDSRPGPHRCWKVVPVYRIIQDSFRTFCISFRLRFLVLHPTVAYFTLALTVEHRRTTPFLSPLFKFPPRA